MQGILSVIGRPLGDVLKRVMLGLTLMASCFTPAFAEDNNLELKLVADKASQTSIWVSFSPTTSAFYSFWYEQQNGIIADWTLPKGYSLGDTQFPEVHGSVNKDVPVFKFLGNAPIIQEILLPEKGGSVHSGIGLSLTYGSCDISCNRVTSSASLGTATVTTSQLPVTLAKRDKGIWARADGNNIAIGMHKSYNQDGYVERAFFLPASASLVDVSLRAPLRLNGFKETGFFRSFNLRDSIAGDAVVAGILILNKPNKGGLEAYSVAPKNDYAVAAATSNDLLAVGAEPSEIGYFTIILFAFLGGLILNAMPCVFPVLALKVFSAIKSNSSDQSEIKKDALVYTLGVVSSFVLIAGVLISIRMLGVSAGWGFQLQSPVFVLAMVLVFFTMALNFLGVFELSGFFAGAGQGLTEKEGLIGTFFTGVLAVLVAAPCTAPFMVTAVAFALSKPPIIALSIFAALGLGLASPYLLIGYVPGSRAYFPRPGLWMNTFKSFLAFPMFATVVWLVWILAIQAGSFGVLIAMTAMVFIAFTLWVLTIVKSRNVIFLVGLCIAVTLYSLSAIKPVEREVNNRSDLVETGGHQMIGDMPVTPFSREKLISLRQEGKNVFIHHWAAWCMICLMHENLVFSQAGFQRYLQDNNIVFMQADRTNNDPQLLKFMERTYGRSSQPIDVFYLSDPEVEPIVLPTLFTLDRVLKIMGGALSEKNS